MQLLAEGIIDRINSSCRSVSASRSRPPRRSIYEESSPARQSHENKSTTPRFPIRKLSRSTSRGHRVSPTSSNETRDRNQSTTERQLEVEVMVPSSSVSEDGRCANLAENRNRSSRYQGLGRSTTPLPGPRSTSAMSQVSFRSLRSINSRLKVKIRSFGQALESRKPKPELDWSSLRAEYELHLARGSIVERCLVEVDVGAHQTERGKWWIDTVWTLADRLSPPLPAVLAQYSASGLLPLLIPLRHSLHSLAIQLPYDAKHEVDRFDQLAQTLTRALWYAKLIEAVIELVSRAGLVKFELVGLVPFDENEFESLSEEEELEKIYNWTGEMRGRTGGGQHWKGCIKV